MIKGLLIILVVFAALLISGCAHEQQTNEPSSNQPAAPPESSPPASTPPVSNPPSAPTESSKTYNIDIKSFAFSPSTLTIKKGDKVVWTNKDSAGHTVTSDFGNELNSGTLSNGESYSHTFNTAGTFEYHCAPHPFMKAKIIVEKAEIIVD